MKLTYCLFTIFLLFTSINLSFAQKQAERANDFMESIGMSGVRPSSYTQEQWPHVKQRLEELKLRYIRSWIFDDAENVSLQHELYRDLGIKYDLIHPTLGTSPTEGITAIKTKYPTLEMIAGIESINEPFGMSSGGTVEDYRNHQIRLYNLVNSDDQLKDIPVIGIATAHPEEYKDLGDLSAYVDFGNIHPYPTVNLPPSGGRLETWLQQVDYSYAGKPIWSTESGYHTNTDLGGTPQHIQAKYLPRLLFYHFMNERIQKTFYFTLMDKFVEPTSKKLWGICLNDSVLTPKPAHTAWKNMSSILDDDDASFIPGTLDYTIEGKSKDTYEVLLQKGDGSFYLILWNDVNLWEGNQELQNDPVPVNIHFNETVRAVNVFIPSPPPTGYGTEPVKSIADPASVSINVLDQITILEIHTQGSMEGIAIQNCPEEAIHAPDTFHFEALLSPKNAILKKKYWSVSDESIAQIDSLGNLYSLSSGIITVRAFTYDSLFSDSCVFEVIKTEVDSVIIPDTLNFTAGESLKIDVQVYPANASFPQVSWSSLDTTIVKIDQEGYLKGIRDGIARVVARSTDSGKADTTVIFTEFIETTALVFAQDTFFIPYPDLSEAENPAASSFFTYEFFPHNASDKSVIIESLNTEVLNFDSDGSILKFAEGMTKIVVTTIDGSFTDTAFIVLNSEYNYISLPIIGDSVLIAEQEQGKNAYDNDLSTSFSNGSDLEKSWIQFYLDGEFPVHEIKIHFFRGNVRTYPLKIKVDSQVVYNGSSEISPDFWSVPLDRICKGDTITLIGTGINSEGTTWFKINEIELVGLPEFIFTDEVKITNCPGNLVREDMTLLAEVFPHNSTDKRIIWSSSDPSVLEVSPFTGQLSPTGTGSATIVAESFFFSGISDECTVEATILPPLPEAFSLNQPAPGTEVYDNLVTFKWETSQYAESYSIYIDDNEDFTSPEVAIFELLTDSLSLDLASLNDKLYFWKVDAYNQAGITGSADYGSFSLLLSGIPSVNASGKVKLYPNPVMNNTITVEPLKDNEVESLDIFSIPGQKVFSKRNIRKRETLFLNLPEGIYIIKLKYGQRVHSGKLIIR